MIVIIFLMLDLTQAFEKLDHNYRGKHKCFALSIIMNKLKVFATNTMFEHNEY